MKKSMLILLVTLLMGAGFAFAEVEVTFHKSFVEPDIGKINHSYKGLLPNMSVNAADYLVQRICGYTGSRFYMDEQKSTIKFQVYRDPATNEECQVDRETGDIFYRKIVNFDGETPSLPLEKNAVAVASNHLMALGLFKPDMGRPIVTTREEATYMDQTTEIVEKERVVIFAREINGIPVKGASRMVVMMGANGQLDGLFARWIEVEKRRAKVNVEQLQIRGHISNHLKSKIKDCISVIVKTAELVLFDNGKGVIEPALFVQGDVTTVNGSARSDWMIPILKEPQAQY
jgi:hypothetical protein